MKPLVAVMIFGVFVPFAASAANQSKEALVAFYGDVESRSRHIEVCYANVCELYRSSNGVTEALWDVAFLHQYHFIAPRHREEFRRRYAAHAADLAARYSQLCPRSSAGDAPSCLIDQLAVRNRITYANVRYDEKRRCETLGRLTNPSFQGKTQCKVDPHAS